jgi:hypothetical protein
LQFAVFLEQLLHGQFGATGGGIATENAGEATVHGTPHGVVGENSAGDVVVEGGDVADRALGVEVFDLSATGWK